MASRVDHVRGISENHNQLRPRRLGAGAPWGHSPAILHLDIDAFFASVEQKRNPRLEGQPVVVGTGVVASASYEARQRGVRAAMSLRDARRLCPTLVILPGHAPTYRAFAEQIFSLTAALSPAVETYLDDAYVDLTGTECLHGHLIRAADELRQRITKETGISVAMGLGSNRMVARMVTRLAKPGGLAWLRPGGEASFVASRPIEELLGVGRRRAALLREMGITRVGEMSELSPFQLRDLFGDMGLLLAARAQGRETRAVHKREVPETIRRETSFSEPATDITQLEGMLHYLTERATGQARKLGVDPGRVRVHLYWSDGKSSARAERVSGYGCVTDELFGMARAILHGIHDRRMGVRNIGVEISRLRLESSLQHSLFDDPAFAPETAARVIPLRPAAREVPATAATAAATAVMAATAATTVTVRDKKRNASRDVMRGTARQKKLDNTVDDIRSRFGFSSLLRGRSLELMKRVKMDKHGFVLRTPCLTR